MSNGFAPPTPVLPSPVAAGMGPGDVTPSVRPFVAALTPTTGHSAPPPLRPSAPPPRIGTLALAGAARSSVSLRTGAAGSHVPNERLCRSRAASMPDAAWAVIRAPPRLVPGQRQPPGFGIVCTLSTRHQRFALARLSDTHLTG